MQLHSAVHYTPVVTSVLFDVGAIGQILKMIREGSSVGQSVSSWIMVTVGLLLWVNYYRVVTPELKLPRYTAAVSAAINFFVAVVALAYR